MVLFTGAGFSSGARNQAGEAVPSVKRLRALLNDLVYPGSELADDDTLTHLFGLAQVRARNRLQDLLAQQFTVDRRAVPEMYGEIFSAAWFRVYTLNIDDLELAVAASHTLARPIVSLTPHQLGSGDGLEVVHLNGRWDDGPDAVTFSPLQYGSRYPGADPLHHQCAVDLLQRPVLFVGTELEEPPLWQAIELRKRASGRDLRKRSFLVTPKISRSKRDYLERELHVEYLPMTLEEFYEHVFNNASDGSQTFFDSQRQQSLWEGNLTRPLLVSDLTVDPNASEVPGEYLLGRSPTWQDIGAGRAAEREYEADLMRLAESILEIQEGPRPVLILTGTAGSGKSTAAMRLAMALTSKGVECAWTSADFDVSPRDLRSSAALGDVAPVLMLDDAGRFGNETSLLARDLSLSEKRLLVVIAVRSGRVERIADRLKLLGVEHHEVVIPRLSDADIKALLKVLDRENRLGVLKGLSFKRQVDEFRNRERANRDLLVAMLEATSGRRFEVRLEEELDQLAGQQQFVYAMVAIGTAYRLGLTRNQVLLGVGDPTNETLQAIEDLTRRLLILEYPDGTLRARHRVVAERILRYLIRAGSLHDPLLSLAMALATELGPSKSRASGAYRTMRLLMNHDWLRRSIGTDPARSFFAELERFMDWDHHYWLQRGSMELERGDPSLAENFLNQAAGIEPNDLLVQTELAYLHLKIAVVEPNLVYSRGSDCQSESLRPPPV
jgi:Mrp family chromosome partitioning ATPase